MLNTERKSDLADESLSATSEFQRDPFTHNTTLKCGVGAESDNNSDKSAEMNTQAYQVLQTLEQLLDVTSTVDDRQDWDSLVSAKTFQSTLTPRPYIKYGEYDAPIDIEYLSMSEPKPEEPELTTRPVLGDFLPERGILDKLAFRERRLLKGGRAAFAKALRQWESERQQAMADYVRLRNKWMESAKAMDAENEKRYRQCVEDQQLWLKQKKLFDEKCRKAMASIDSFRQAYPHNEASAARL